MRTLKAPEPRGADLARASIPLQREKDDGDALFQNHKRGRQRAPTDADTSRSQLKETARCSSWKGNELGVHCYASTSKEKKELNKGERSDRQSE